MLLVVLLLRGWLTAEGTSSFLEFHRYVGSSENGAFSVIDFVEEGRLNLDIRLPMISGFSPLSSPRLLAFEIPYVLDSATTRGLVLKGYVRQAGPWNRLNAVSVKVELGFVDDAYSMLEVTVTADEQKILAKLICTVLPASRGLRMYGGSFVPAGPLTLQTERGLWTLTEPDATVSLALLTDSADLLLEVPDKALWVRISDLWRSFGKCRGGATTSSPSTSVQEVRVTQNDHLIDFSVDLIDFETGRLLKIYGTLERAPRTLS